MRKSAINQLAVLSFFIAILSTLSLCIGVMPIPLTDLFCYPACFVLDIISFIMGLIALRQIRSTSERGRGLAIAGLWISFLTGFSMLCVVALTISMIPIIINFVNKVWVQLHP
jgi:hypothetical protein